MEVIGVVLLAFTLAFVSAAFNSTIFEERKIAGGFRTDISFVNSQVAVIEEDKLKCSGHLVKADVVLTVAHCVAGKDILLLKIRSGSNHYSKNGRVVAILRLTPHPDYKSSPLTYEFDIALLFLEESAIAVGIPADIITLWDADTVFSSGALGRVSGWGLTKEDGELSAFLRTVSLPIISRDNCDNFYGSHRMINSICVGFSAGGKGACKGDSGAGFVINKKLAGIHAFGQGCGRPKTPEAYISIPLFRKWIHEVAGI